MPTEADTCRKYVVPLLQTSGWDSEPCSIAEQRSITDGRIIPVGQRFVRKPPKRADYLLFYRRDFCLAVVEAKAAYKSVSDGLQQSKLYAEMLGLMFAYATNGVEIVEFDYFTGLTSILTAYPAPAELWKRYQQGRGITDATTADSLLTPSNNTAGKHARYYQQTAINRTVEAVLQGQRKRLLLTMANGYLGVDNPGRVNRGKGGDAEAQSRYVRTCEQMMTELWTRYGDLFEIWFDGGAIPAAQGGPDLVPILKRHQPQAIVFQGPAGTPNLIRWVGNERGVAPYPCWSTANAGTSEGGTVEKVVGGNPDGALWVPGECDVPVRNHDWFWTPGGEQKLYSVEQLTQMYANSVGRNCNLLLNANPDPDGLVPEADLQRYAEFGREIKRRFLSPLATTAGKGAAVELALPKPQAVSQIAVMEDIALGERVRAYEVEGLAPGGAWVKLCDGSSVGHKRIQTFASTEVARLRFRATASVAEPQIRQFAAFNTGA